MLYGVLCVVACVVLVRFIVYHVKDVLVCFGDDCLMLSGLLLCVVVYSCSCAVFV